MSWDTSGYTSPRFKDSDVEASAPLFRAVALVAILAAVIGIASHSMSEELVQGKERGVEEIQFPFSEQELVSKTFSLAREYFADFQDPETHVLYGARLSSKQNWTSPEDVKAGKPQPWGYGSRIADTALHCGHTLAAMLDAYDARPDTFLRDNCRKLFRALKLIGSICPVPGLVPRGPHPDDMTAYYDDSSMDQHTTFIISLALYANSSIATAEEKAWIRDKLQSVGERLEKNGWSIKRADGVTQSHVGFSWKGYNAEHASILLPSVLSLYKGAGNEHWLETYEKLGAERGGLRWEKLEPGPHVKISAHPIYANQISFRLRALYDFETDPRRKAIVSDLLQYTAKLQLERDFPGPFYRKFHSDETWRRARESLGWDDDNLHGCDAAWGKFRPSFLNSDDPIAALAHVRFPLGGFYMVLLSGRRQLVKEHVRQVWGMLTGVDLKRIYAGETNYLFTATAMHLYAFYFRGLKLSKTRAEADQQRGAYGKELPIVGNLGIGRAMDVFVEGDKAYIIGAGRLYVADASLPGKPRVIGDLGGLGNVRQIVVHDGVAYITAREDGLFVVDVTKGEGPKLLCHYDTIEFATGVAFSGDLLFVACRSYGVEIIDISNPSQPEHLSIARTGEAQSVVARDGYLYAGVWGTSEVAAVDVSNPRLPVITARVPLDGFGDGVDVRGNYLYVATGHHSRSAPHRKDSDPGFGRGHGLEIFDISDPGKPEFLSRVKTPRLYELGMDMWSVTASGGYAFLADTYNGVFVVDVSNPKRPRFVAHRELPFVESRKLPGPVGGLALVEDHIYVAGAWTDLHILHAPGMASIPPKEPDAAPSIPPFHPERETEYRVYRPKGQVHAVDFIGEYAVAACGGAGIHVVQLWPKIETRAVYDVEGFATDVRVLDRNVYVAEGSGGLSIWAASEKGELAFKGRYRPGKQAVKQVVIPPPGKYALLQVAAYNLHVVDVSDPAAPKVALKDKRLGLLYRDQIMDGLIENRYACVFWHVSGLYWYDLYGGATPTYTGDNYSQRIGSANGLVAFRGKTLAICRGGYAMLDRSERRPLDELPIYRAGKHRLIGKPTIFGDRLYVSHRASGAVSVIDVANPAAPRLLRAFTTSGNPGRIVVKKDAIIVPDGYHGLLIYD